jgi:uncharacterized membrane protein (DUF485 family)
MPDTAIAPQDADNATHTAEFHALAGRKNKVSLALTLAIMAVYYGFIFLIAFRKDLVGAKLSAHVTWGIPLGLGVILLSWVATGIYVTWANRKYDGMADALRAKWGK